jgi:cyclopropane fatty-acyl-phospholipid synthase-like methyltransferase
MHGDNGNPLPVALEQRTQDADQRMFSPSAARNAEPILTVLKGLFPAHGAVLEIGCGTGEHAVCFAAAMPTLTWLPTDPDPASRASTASWIEFRGLSNILAPIDVDTSSPVWGVEKLAPFDAMLSINMIHIAPWEATTGLFSGAGRLLRGDGPLCLYGPFMHNGAHNAPSNADFDQFLRARNPAWGLRDIADLESTALAYGLRLGETVAMPANNTLLVFRRAA